VKHLQSIRLNDLSRGSCFSTDTGCAECFVTVRTRPNQTLAAALESLGEEYESALGRLDLSDETPIFSRLFVSDYVNQKELLDASPLVERLRAGVLSVIEEKPVDGGPVALLSYHLRGFGAARSPGWRRSEHARGDSNLVRGKNYSLLFTANHADGEGFDAYRQTDVVFRDVTAAIERNGMKLLDNTIRTWIFVRDIDNHYESMVRARKQYFTDHGLTERTRYLASTGIEGGGWSPDQLVTLDSLSIGPLVAGQIVRMQTPSHMSPTTSYGVTFERGLRVRFGDRSHLHVSGTASIDHKGDVLHVGDAAGQARRAVENVRALLAEQDATVADLAYLICYVRNLHEWASVQDVLNAEVGTSVPIVPVVAKVCRPSWLFELEGLALVADQTDYAPFA
jgi:enamine deaminase RidA (YjgF/YER057c/UK114 family)